MILEQETFEAYRYYPSTLLCRSGKHIVVACELCGEFRVTSKHDYRTLCGSCAHTGKIFTDEHKVNIGAGLEGRTLTDEHKANMSAARAGKNIGEKNHFFSKTHTEKSKALISAKMKGNCLGEKNPNYRGGKKIAQGRKNAKRKELGYTLLLPLKDGEVGHHVTNEDVIGIPKEVHEQFSGYRRKKHRALILEWLKENEERKHKIVLHTVALNP